MSSHDIVLIVVALLGGSGITGAVVALLKFPRESGQMFVTTAKDVVLIQSGVIERLEKEITRQGEELEDLRIECREREEMLLKRIKELEHKAETGSIET